MEITMYISIPWWWGNQWIWCNANNNMSIKNINIAQASSMAALLFACGDKRDIDIEDYSVIRSYEKCISILQFFKNEIEVICLDYDLGETSLSTGYNITVYMFNNNITPKHIIIHSTHETGSRKIFLKF